MRIADSNGSGMAVAPNVRNGRIGRNVFLTKNAAICTAISTRPGGKSTARSPGVEHNFEKDFVMNMRMMILAGALLAMPVMGFAADTPQPGAGPKAERHAVCKSDPEKCRQERRAQREKMCAENPERCKEAKAKMEERRAQCQADPAKCQQERKAYREKMCTENPERCKEAKAKMEERRAQCQADPVKCQEERKAQREKMCAENPERCKEAKAKMEERRAQCQADPAKCRPQNPAAPAYQPRI